MGYLGKLLKIPGFYKQFKQNTKTQKSFLQDSVLKDIGTFIEQEGNPLNDTDLKKINYYYGNAVVSILGEGFCTLRGQPMTDKERGALTYLGAMTGLVDDFFDEQKTTHEHIKLLIDEPEVKHAQSLREKLFIQFCQKALADVPDTRLTKEAADRVFHVQVQSKKQLDPNITRDEIEQITYEKGASSIQFYRTVFGTIEDENERTLIEKIGHIGQLENDIFDVHKDSLAGIQTLPLRSSSIADIRSRYHGLHEDIKALAQQTHYDQEHINDFLLFIGAIISRGYVCLDFLARNEMGWQGADFSLFTKKNRLVCDMEKPLNILRSLHYFAKYA